MHDLFVILLLAGSTASFYANYHHSEVLSSNGGTDDYRKLSLSSATAATLRIICRNVHVFILIVQLV